MCLYTYYSSTLKGQEGWDQDPVFGVLDCWYAKGGEWLLDMITGPIFIEDMITGKRYISTIFTYISD